MAAEWCPDQIWVNLVRKFDSDKDGMLGFENGEFEDLVSTLLVMAGREDDENSSLAVHVTSVIALHPGFRGQKGATNASLRNAAYAGVFQDLTPVLHEWLHRNGQRYLLQQEQERQQKEQQSRRIVTAQRKYKAAPPPQNAPPRDQALPQALPQHQQHYHSPQEHHHPHHHQQYHPQHHTQHYMRIQQLYQPENEQECQYRSMAPSLDALVRGVLARTCASA